MTLQVTDVGIRERVSTGSGFIPGQADVANGGKYLRLVNDPGMIIRVSIRQSMIEFMSREEERIRILRGLRNQVPPSRPSRATGAALDHVAAFLFRTRPAEAEFITREQPSRFVPFFDCKYNLSKFLQCPESGNLPQPTPPNRDAWVSHSA